MVVWKVDLGGLLSILVFLIVLVLIFVLFIVFLLPYVMLGLFLVEWDFLVFKYNFYFDSLVFSFVLLLVTLSVFFFSTYYLSGELNFSYYYFVLLIFVGSMFSLTCRSGSFSMLVSWDLLGISRFFLVLFYNN